MYGETRPNPYSAQIPVVRARRRLLTHGSFSGQPLVVVVQYAFHMRSECCDIRASG